MGRLRASGADFVDEHGRVCFLRGVNLGGDTKVPYKPSGATHLRDSLSVDDHRSVSFVGRPFPREEAEEHFARLEAWGFSCLRFLVTWEAIEHDGPGIYDEEYLEYVHDMLKLAREHGFWIYIDPHQDVWSRWTGGDGAPAWTLEKVGFDLTALAETGAALTHQEFEERPEDFPKMMWPTNYFKLACATMFTLFWGGNKFAPKLLIDGEPVQDYLQGHYIAAISALAAKLSDLDNVVGYGTMNEPNPGFIGVKDLDSYYSTLKRGYMPTAAQAFALGSGLPQTVKCLNKIGMAAGKMKMNPAGRSAWSSGRSCVWRAHGVWADGTGDKEATDLKYSRSSTAVGAEGGPIEVVQDYFAGDFGRDHYLPFAQRFAAGVRRGGGEHQLVFAELPPADLGVCGFPKMSKEELPGAVNASHWYDNMTLYLSTYNKWLSLDVQTMTPAVGPTSVRDMFARQVGELKELAEKNMGGVPTLIGECGIPFSMNNCSSYCTGDWSSQCEAMDATIVAMERNLLSYTLWCYAASHTPEWGDGWNLEDLSIYSKSQRTDEKDINSGGRALTSVVRPYAQVVAGRPTSMRFNRRDGSFKLEFETSGNQQGEANETRIFVPLLQYPAGFIAKVSDGNYQVINHGKHGVSKLVLYSPECEGSHIVEILDPARQDGRAWQKGQSSACCASW